MYQERGISLGLSVTLFSEMLAIYRNSNSRRRAYVALYPSGDCRAIISQATIRRQVPYAHSPIGESVMRMV